MTSLCCLNPTALIFILARTTCSVTTVLSVQAADQIIMNDSSIESLTDSSASRPVSMDPSHQQTTRDSPTFTERANTILRTNKQALSDPAHTDATPIRQSPSPVHQSSSKASPPMRQATPMQPDTSRVPPNVRDPKIASGSRMQQRIFRSIAYTPRGRDNPRLPNTSSAPLPPPPTSDADRTLSSPENYQATKLPWTLRAGRHIQLVRDK